MREPIFSYQGTPLIVPEKYNNNKNSFTILVGNNGVGKSRLLSSLSRSLIETTEFSIEDRFDNRYRDNYLFNQPKIIAVSTSPFDAFKLPGKTGTSKKIDFSNYRYIGMRGAGLFSSGSISLISSAASGLLDKLRANAGLDRLNEVFSVLGFHPSMEFIFKPLFQYPRAMSEIERAYSYNDEDEDYLYKSEKEYASKIHKIQNYFGVRVDTKLHNTLISLSEHSIQEIGNALKIFEKFEFERAYFKLHATHDIGWNYQFDNHYIDNELLLGATQILLQHGLVKLMDLKLSKPSNTDMSLRRASSGEQCMLVIMLGIAGHITDHSKVFIDEPEISLHPQWQEKFMSLLIEVFSPYYGCNFYIATHSPQTIAKLNAENCFITSLTNKKIYLASDFRERSADFQLAELFDAPGSMNEYIIRLAFELIAKLKSEQRINYDEWKTLGKLNGFAEKLEPQDPLLELIKTTNEMCDYYANNQ